MSQWKRIVFATNDAETIGYSIATNPFPGGSAGKESASNARDLDSILGWGDPLEKGMATHSSMIAWKIPWNLLHILY